MTRTRRFLGGAGVTYMHQVVVMALGLWLTPFLIGRLGAHEFGLWLAATQLITYLSLLDLGVLALLPRDAAYATGRAGGALHGADLPAVIGNAARFVWWQMPFIAVATLVAWWFLPDAWRPLEGPMAVLLLAFVLTYPLRIFQATLQGLQDLSFVGTLQLAAWVIGTAVAVKLVLSGWGLGALAAGAVVTQSVALGGCGLRVLSRFRAVLPRTLPRLPWRDARPLVHRALWVSLSQLAQVLLHGTDVLIVAWVFGPVAVVPYACTQKLISALANQPHVLTQAAAPALSELRMEASREKLFSVTSSLSLALMLASGGVFVVVLAVNRAFVSWWVGPDLYGGAVLTLLFAGAMLVRHWNTALVYSLFSFGHERRLSITTVSDGIVTLVASIALARAVGAYGVPLGALCGALLVSVPANLTALSRETGASPGRFAAALLPWGVRVAGVAAVAAVANLLVATPGILAILAVVGGVAAVYIVLMLPLALRPPLGIYVRSGLAPVLGHFGFAPDQAAAKQTV